MITKTCFIMGYPSTGKTTFIAALWHSIQQKKTYTKYKLKKYVGNQSYLATIEKDWLTGKEVSRTFLPVQNESLLLTLVDDLNNEINFSFPDFSGELFNNIYIDREISVELEKKICESHAFVLFLSPKTTYQPENIATIPLDIRQGNDSEEENLNYDKVKHDSTAAKLIELLQIVDYLCQSKCIKLSVIVSAWDRVCMYFQNPDEYIKKSLSMLWQYLKANSKIFNVKYYGVSAQGTELNDLKLSQEKNAENVERLLEKHESNPVERIQVVDNQGNICHDITLPLWDLISGE